MNVLYRPHEGRLIGGVALALHQHTGLSLHLLRLVFIAFVLTSNQAILLYLLLWLALPGERRVFASLSIRDEIPSGRAGFEHVVDRLLDRLKPQERSRAISALLAFVLLFAAVLMQLSNLDRSGFAVEHPFLSTLLGTGERYGGILTYASLCLLFTVPAARHAATPRFQLPSTALLQLDRSPSRMLFGLMSGLARTLQLDPFVLRAIAVLLIPMTLGGVVVLYLVMVIMLERRTEDYRRTHVDREGDVFLPRNQRWVVVASLFVLFVVRTASEFRWFFFNEPYVRGIVFIVLGMTLFLWGIRHWRTHLTMRVWLLVGPALVFFGIYEFSTAVFYVQLPFAARFQLGYLIAGTAFVYYAIVALRGRRVLYAVGLGVFFYFLVLVTQFNLIPSNGLLLLIQFYEFFYPVIFAGAGLWVVMEK